MQVNSMLPVYSDDIRGVVYYNNVFPNVNLGQASGTRFSTTFGVENPSRVHRAFLELGLVVSDMSRLGFIVLFNKVTVTREFKPAACASLGDDRKFCKVVYDATPIIASKPSNSCRVEVEYRGMREVTLAHLGFLVLQEHPDATTRLAYLSGALSLEPSASTSVALPGPIDSPEVRVASFIPHSSAALRLTAGGSSATLRGHGFNEHTVRMSGSVDAISIEHVGDGRYYPREVLLSSILVHATNAPQPVLEASATIIAQGRVRVDITNKGSAPARNVIVVVLHKGMVLARRIIESIEEKGQATLELPVEPGSTVRVIWRHLDRTLFREVKLR